MEHGIVLSPEDKKFPVKKIHISGLMWCQIRLKVTEIRKEDNIYIPSVMVQSKLACLLRGWPCAQQESSK